MNAHSGTLADELAELTEVWWRAVTDVTALLDELTEADFGRATDLPGWDVRAVAAHLAHLESVLAGGPKETADVADLPHVRGPLGRFTEIGVINRRDRSGREIAAELREVTARRRESLSETPALEPEAKAPGIFGAIGWSTRTLFRNRPLDIWLHEQDVRRAVGRPGNLDSPAADHTTAYLLESLGFVLAKRVGAPAGTTVSLRLDDGHVATATVGEDGRGRLLAEPGEPDAAIGTDRESFLLRAAGRREVPLDRFAITGDAALGERVVANLAVTP